MAPMSFTIANYVWLAGFLLASISLTRQQAASSSSPREQLARGISLWNLMLKGGPKVSPLYLINGTICRYINYTPICTVLATTGLQTSSQASSSGSAGSPNRAASSGSGGGSSGSGGGGGAGSGGSSSGGSGGGSSGGGSGGSGGGGGGGSGSGGSGGSNRPSTAGQLSGSSVQYVARPSGDDSLDPQMDGSGASASNSGSSGQLQLQQPQQPATNWLAPARPMGLVVRRRPFGFFGFRRPIQRSQGEYN